MASLLTWTGFWGLCAGWWWAVLCVKCPLRVLSTDHSSTKAKDLAAKTEPAKLGEVTCFFSHSWRDEEEAPGAKFQAFSSWARRHQDDTGKEPTLWLVRSLPARHCPSPQPPTRARRCHRTKRASTSPTLTEILPACPCSYPVASSCSSWRGPRTASGCGA